MASRKSSAKRTGGKVNRKQLVGQIMLVAYVLYILLMVVWTFRKELLGLAKKLIQFKGEMTNLNGENSEAETKVNDDLASQIKSNWVKTLSEDLADVLN